MKRLASSDSLPPLVTICPSTEEQSPRNKHVYGREFQSMLEGLDEEGCVEESGHHGEKKRRLSVEQVKALEKNFEVENKLEPDRKVKLAQELGLQPRQVAVWFQNRRARWKTKQLERDYGVLKANYEALKLNFDKVQQDNQALLKEIKELKSRVEEEKSESDASVKEERITVQESKKGEGEGEGEGMVPRSDDSKELNYEYECFSKCEEVEVGSLFAADTKDGFSDSDSSAILNDESPNNNNNINNNNNNNNNNISSSSCGGLQSHSLFVSPPSGSFQFHKQYYVKMEEHNLLSADEACNFFSDEQPPTLHWYCSDEWS